MRPGDRAIRWTTTLNVVALAGIAAVLSYKHMYALVQRYGETSWTAALVPVSVDGMIAASSMTLLADSRHGRRSGFLPWALVVIGSMASLAANVAVAEPSAVGRLVAAWPSAALIGSYELLMRQIRHGAASTAASYISHTSPGAGQAVENAAYTAPADARQVPCSQGGADDPYSREYEQADRRCERPQRQVPGLQRDAWRWAIANRTPSGDLPSGKAIAEHFGRRERWGRLVKQAGAAGRLDP